MIHIIIDAPGEKPQVIVCQNYLLVADIDSQKATLLITDDATPEFIAGGLCQLENAAPGMLSEIADCINGQLDEMEGHQ